jgi:hypothetical protein
MKKGQENRKKERALAFADSPQWEEGTLAWALALAFFSLPKPNYSLTDPLSPIHYAASQGELAKKA